MVVNASIAGEFAASVGVLAGMIAIGGFLAHAQPVLTGAPDRRVRVATVVGGIAGFGVGLFVVVLSAIAGRVIV